jgi:molecular chaperone GrpE (heat shock protein)
MFMSSQSSEEIDFSDALEVLVAEASGAASPARAESPHATPAPRPGDRAAYDFAKTIRPLVMAVDALVRSSAETAKRLAKLEGAVAGQEDWGGFTKELRDAMENRGGVNRDLFNALHEELKSYKENFLIEIFQKPVVRDLIGLFDDLTLQHEDLEAYIRSIPPEAAANSLCFERVKIVAQNLDHSAHSVLEALARAGVERIPAGKGKLDRQSQKAVGVEATENPAEDGDVVRSVRPGFRWRDRVFRPEEVVVKKYKEGYLVAFGGEE